MPLYSWCWEKWNQVSKNCAYILLVSLDFLSLFNHVFHVVFLSSQTLAFALARFEE